MEKLSERKEEIINGLYICGRNNTLFWLGMRFTELLRQLKCIEYLESKGNE